MPVMSKHFPGVALDPVTNYCASDLPADSDTQAWIVEAVCLPDDKKTFDTDFIRRIKKFKEVGTFP